MKKIIGLVATIIAAYAVDLESMSSAECESPFNVKSLSKVGGVI